MLDYILKKQQQKNKLLTQICIPENDIHVHAAIEVLLNTAFNLKYRNLQPVLERESAHLTIGKSLFSYKLDFFVPTIWGTHPSILYRESQYIESHHIKARLYPSCDQFSNIVKFTRRMITIFASTYLCEQTFF